MTQHNKKEDKVMAEMNKEKVVVDGTFEEVKDENFSDVPGVQDENETKQLPAKKERKVTKRDAIAFGIGVAVGATATAVAGLLYAKFGVGDPGQVAEKVAEVVPDVVG